LYRPGTSCDTVKYPSLLVAVCRRALVSTFTNEIFTSGTTAPAGSRAVPLSVVVVCAHAVDGSVAMNKAANMASPMADNPRYRISHLPSCCTFPAPVVLPIDLVHNLGGKPFALL